MKTIKLLYPEWQGFGTNNHANTGAFTIHNAFLQGSKFVEIDVFQKEHLLVEGCYAARLTLLDKYPEYLAPRQVYGLE